MDAGFIFQGNGAVVLLSVYAVKAREEVVIYCQSANVEFGVEKG